MEQVQLHLEQSTTCLFGTIPCPSDLIQRTISNCNIPFNNDMIFGAFNALNRGGFAASVTTKDNGRETVVVH